MERKIWAVWPDVDQMSDNRKAALRSMSSETFHGVDVEFLDVDGIARIVADVGIPLHPAYKYLSPVHRSDYLRCYLLHHIGGGYADIKRFTTDNNWPEMFDLMGSRPKLQLIGEPEIPGGTPVRIFDNPSDRSRLVCLRWFIARGGTPLTDMWYRGLIAKMDDCAEKLERFYAERTVPWYRGDRLFSLGYPFRWADILGRVLHPVLHEHGTGATVYTGLRAGMDKNNPYL